MAAEPEERIAIESDNDVVTARQRARELAAGLELTSTDQTLLATAISEVARNITTYATARRGAAVDRARRRPAAREGIRVVARDKGPGIADVDLAMQDGYTSGGGLGLGLPGARRLVDEFDIETAPGRRHDRHAGQVVEGALKRSPTAGPASSRSASRGWRSQGEDRSGDLAVFAPYDRGGLAVVIDGLGHGDDAADASAIAERVIREHASDPPATLLSRCHEALRKSRGVVLTAAWFDLEALQLSWAGVGNVEARLVRGAAAYGDRHDSALVLGGRRRLQPARRSAPPARICGWATRSPSPPTGSRPTTRPR